MFLLRVWTPLTRGPGALFLFPGPAGREAGHTPPPFKPATPLVRWGAEGATLTAWFLGGNSVFVGLYGATSGCAQRLQIRGQKLRVWTRSPCRFKGLNVRARGLRGAQTLGLGRGPEEGLEGPGGGWRNFFARFLQ